ncbi:DinB family protein [Fredinandcohnia humi]
MKSLFYYNWQVRDEWFQLCGKLSNEELLAKRTGGFGNILHTLLHIVVVEYDWIHDITGEPVADVSPEDFRTLDDVIVLHKTWQPEVKSFVEAWSDELHDKPLILENGKYQFTYGEVMQHLIAHEIHHVGQLSVWARELGLTPVNANFINRGLK